MDPAARGTGSRIAPGAVSDPRHDQQIARAGGDFAALAEKHSDDPGTMERGGDLGWFGRGGIDPEFDKAVFAAKPGDIVGPVRSRYGYHIIKVDEKKPEATLAFSDEKDKIEQFLKQQKTREKIENYLEGLRKNAKIDKFI